MNNDELKKKIVEVLKPVIRAGNISCNEENACKKCWFPCEIERTAGRLADALIAAGIGDVKESENKATAAELVAQEAASTAIKKIAEWKHRAEVAEKIAEEACEIVFCEAIDNEEWDEVIRNYKKTKEKDSDEFGITDEMLYDYLHEKAEKKFAEERK